MTFTDYGFYVLCGTAIVLLATQAVLDPRTFFQVLDFGIADGAIYALVALGYTMVYGIIELINFAHGDIFTLSAVIGSAILGFFTFSDNYVGSRWTHIIVFSILIAVLVFRPTGLLGMRVPEK